MQGVWTSCVCLIVPEMALRTATCVNMERAVAMHTAHRFIRGGFNCLLKAYLSPFRPTFDFANHHHLGSMPRGTKRRQSELRYGGKDKMGASQRGI